MSLNIRDEMAFTNLIHSLHIVQMDLERGSDSLRSHSHEEPLARILVFKA